MAGLPRRGLIFDNPATPANVSPMDEDEYKELYHSVNQVRCVFEKAVLTRLFACEKLIKINIAEREAASCTDTHAQHECAKLLDKLRGSASFALGLTHASGPLPHAKEVKAQCGGLTGLKEVTPDEARPERGVENIYSLIQQAKREFGGLDDFPYSDIVRSIAAYEGRKRRRR